MLEGGGGGGGGAALCLPPGNIVIETMCMPLPVVMEVPHSLMPLRAFDRVLGASAMPLSVHFLLILPLENVAL